MKKLKLNSLNKAKLAFDMLEKEMESLNAIETRMFIGGSGNNPCSLSASGAHFIQTAEGGFYSQVYDDGAGFDTVGYGHRLTQAEIDNGTYSSGITQAEAHALFLQDSQNAVNAVCNSVTADITQEQFDALVSFAYNVGVSNFQSSTLLQKLNNEDYDGAATEFSNWVYSGGSQMSGLVTRRSEEEELFSTGDYYFSY